MNGKNWYSVYFSSHFKGTNGFLCDFSVLLYLFQTTSQKSRQDEEEHICLLYFGRKIHFSNFREDAGLPELASGSTIGEPSTDSRKSESNKRFLTDSVIIILFIFSTFITYYFTFGQEPPASITALPFSGAEAPL